MYLSITYYIIICIYTYIYIYTCMASPAIIYWVPVGRPPAQLAMGTTSWVVNMRQPSLWWCDWGCNHQPDFPITESWDDRHGGSTTSEVLILPWLQEFEVELAEEELAAEMQAPEDSLIGLSSSPRRALDLWILGVHLSSLSIESRIYGYFYQSVCLSVCLSVGLSIYLSKILSILSYPILSHLILSYPILSYLILSYPILSYLILSYPILSYLILSYPILSYLILSYPILSYLILSYPILSYLILSYPIWSYLILSYPILSYLVLSYPILSYLILSYPIYLSIYLSIHLSIYLSVCLSIYLINLSI